MAWLAAGALTLSMSKYCVIIIISITSRLLISAATQHHMSYSNAPELKNAQLRTLERRVCQIKMVARFPTSAPNGIAMDYCQCNRTSAYR